MRKLLILLLALTSTVQAYDLFADRCWEVGGEALFWRPCGGPYDYGNETVSGFVRRDLSLKPDYDVGFRIWGATFTHDCCHLFDVDWIHLRTFDKQREVGDFIIFPSAGLLTDAVVNANLKFGYDKVTVRAGRYIARYCNSMAWAYGGAGYLNLKRNQQATAVAANGAVLRNTERASYEGGLLEVGVGVDVEEPYCFHLIGHLAGIVGIGERKLRQTLLSAGNITEFLHPGETSCITGLQMKLGVQWRYQYRCAWLMLQVSYELDQYFDAFRLAESQPLVNGVPTSGLQNVGFSGPSVSAAVRF